MSKPNYIRQQDSISCASVALYNAHLYFQNYIDSNTYNRIKSRNYNYSQPTYISVFLSTMQSEFPYPDYTVSRHNSYDLNYALDTVSNNSKTVAVIGYQNNPISHIVLFTGEKNGKYHFINHHIGEMEVTSSQIPYMFPISPGYIYFITKNISDVKIINIIHYTKKDIEKISMKDEKKQIENKKEQKITKELQKELSVIKILELNIKEKLFRDFNIIL